MNLKYALLIAGSLIFCACGDKKPGAEQPVAADRSAIPLITLQQQGIAERVTLPAQLAAYQQVSLFPKVNGYVKTVLVDIGSKVKKGQLLMELEAPELQQASLQAEEKYAQAGLVYTIDKENYERMKQASRTAGAVSPMLLAQTHAKALADSTVWNAEKASWEIQRTLLGYLKVTAPFDGVISERNVHPGALVSAESRESKPMLEIQQVDRLRLQMDIPERIVSTLPDNAKIIFYLNAFPGKKMEGELRRRAGVVNVQDRSEKTELDVINPTHTLAPGMFGQAEFWSSGNPEAFAVPKSAVITSTERKYVWSVRAGKAVKTDVSTGNETVDSIEIVGGLHAGDQLIRNGSDEMKEGIVINQQ